MQDHVLQYGFSDQDEEILFFKEVKPKFCGRLMYYYKVYNLEAGRPVFGTEIQKSWYQNELGRIKSFFDDNKFWYQYLRSGETDLDEKLFLRSPKNNTLHFRVYYFNEHPSFTTHYDSVFSYITANELLLDYLQNAMFLLNTESSTGNKPAIQSPAKSLTWSESKSALIEFAYACKAKGIFNNGKATLKDITDYLQQVFNIELTNPSRDFQEILRRKTGYTIFLDGLKDSYLKYIDAIESKDRR